LFIFLKLENFELVSNRMSFMSFYVIEKKMFVRFVIFKGGS